MKYFLIFVLFKTLFVLIKAESVIDLPLITVDYRIEDGNITFEIVANSRGYVGIGFSNSSGMYDADMFIGGVWSNASLYFGDYTAKGPGMPVLDEEQNWELISGRETLDGVTSLTITRKLDTGDFNDVQVTEGEMTFIWAVGNADGLENHFSQRGQVLHTFLNPDEPEPISAVIINYPHIYLNYTLIGDTLTFDMITNTTGWAGLGFSNVSGMVNSDIFIGGMNDDGSLYSGDYTSFGEGMPSLDDEQNWELISVSEDNDRTYIKMSRKLDTGDPNDIIIVDKRIPIIWACGVNDNISYHGTPNRGSMLFNLITGSPTN